MNGASTAAAPAPRYLAYRLTLRAPAIVADRSGDPNSAATLPYIPGSAIRGALAAKLLAGGVSDDSPRFEQLILSGQVRFLNAYPCVSEQRSLPVPIALRADKHAPASGFDLAGFGGQVGDATDAGDGVSERDGLPWPDVPLAAPQGLFVTASGAGLELLSPARRARLHQQRDRDKGRAWKGRDEVTHGAVFAYEYLETGQVFSGLIQFWPGPLAGGAPERSAAVEGPTLSDAPSEPACADEDAVTDIAGCLRAHLQAELWVGRSRRAGYGGRAEVRFEDEPHDLEYRMYRERQHGDVRSGERFRMLLTAAYVGRDGETGQVDPAALEAELRAHLPVVVERRFLGTERLAGFNRKWRLNLPEVPALAAGTTLVLKATEPIAAQRLRSVEHAGLGERRVEGYGRVVFVAHKEWGDGDTLELQPYCEPSAVETPPELPAQDQGLVEEIETRILLRAAKEELDRLAHVALVRDAVHVPAGSLLGRLRVRLRSVVDGESAERALSSLAQLCTDGLEDTAKTALERCKLGETDRHCSLLAWLQQLSAPPQAWSWSWLGEQVPGPSRFGQLAQRYRVTTMAEAGQRLDDHSALLTAYLVDSTLAALSRRNRRGEG